MPDKPPSKQPSIRLPREKMPKEMDDALWLDALRDQDEALARLVALVYLLSEVHRTGSSALYGAADPGVLEAVGTLPARARDLQANLRETARDLEGSVLDALATIRAFMDAGPARWADAARVLEGTGDLPGPAPSDG